MEGFFKYFTPVTYWILIIIWLYIFIFYLNKIKYKWKQDKLLGLLLLILSIDALRTLLESMYFGIWYTSLSGLIPIEFFNFLAQPQIVFFPKIINLITAILILTILINKWLPSEIIQKEKINNLIKEQNAELLKKNRELIESTNALKESEERFRNLSENAPVLINSFDKNGHCLFWNKQCHKTFGWTMEEINEQKAPMSLFYPDPSVCKNVISTISTHPDGSFREWHPVTKDGKTLSTMWANFSLPNGQVFSMGHDITKRKQAEEALKESEEKTRNLITKMMNAFALHEMTYNDKGEAIDYKFLEVNPAWEEIVGIKSEMVIGKTLLEIMPEIENSWIDRYSKIVETGIPEEFEEYSPSMEKYFYCYAYRPELGKFAVFFNDITEKKQTIKNALKEKEILIQEIHHRVKNNMQVIYSLLKLQADKYTDNPVIFEAFTESQNHLLSMATVHQMLYQSEDMTIINIRDYIEQMIELICGNYGYNVVQYEIEADDIFFNIDKAVPAGLIINEVISNSLKHSKDIASLLVKFELKKEHGHVVFHISDNGKGFSEGFDIKESETLGCQLLIALTDQLNGEISLYNDNGAHFHISIPIEK